MKNQLNPLATSKNRKDMTTPSLFNLRISLSASKTSAKKPR